MEGVDINKLSLEEKMNIVLANMVMKSDMADLKKDLSTQMTDIKDTLGKQITDIKSDVSTLKEARNEDQKSMKATNMEVDTLRKELNGMKIYVKQAKIREINQDVHSRRFNLIVGNLPDEGAWEAQSTSMSKVRSFLRLLNDTEYTEDEGVIADNWNPDAIVIKEAHRLPQDPSKMAVLETEGQRQTPVSKRNRLMVVKFESMIDINIILKKCRHLKLINGDKPVHKRYFVERHLPRVLQNKKKTLKGEFNQLKTEGRRPGYRYDVNSGTMRVTCKNKK